MATQTAETTAELPCHQCGYDLRAHPPNGKCPECGASVAEALRMAAIPRRPAWRDSDPRWRRRILAGVWILALLPLMDVLNVFGWASHVPVLNIFGYGAVSTLGDTFLGSSQGVYEPLIFCIGVVLLFSKERGRREAKLDWTRRWGVLCSYVVLLLYAAPLLFISALVMVGIAAIFQSMPLKYQPGVTQWFVDVSSAYLRYGPQLKEISAVVRFAFSSIAILLACIPLFDALRSTCLKRLGAIAVVPLALFSLMHLERAAWYCVTSSRSAVPDTFFDYGVYFRPDVLAKQAAKLLSYQSGSGYIFSVISVEAAKWGIILAIAIWLSIAQLAARWQKEDESRIINWASRASKRDEQ